MVTPLIVLVRSIPIIPVIIVSERAPVWIKPIVKPVGIIWSVPIKIIISPAIKIKIPK